MTTDERSARGALRVVEPDDTGRPAPLSGEQIMGEISALIAIHLPDVPFDDPYRGALASFALAAPLRRTDR